jgi:hypothetical protein
MPPLLGASMRCGGEEARRGWGLGGGSAG